MEEEHHGAVSRAFVKVVDAQPSALGVIDLDVDRREPVAREVGKALVRCGSPPVKSPARMFEGS